MTFQPAPEIVLVHADTKTTTTDGPDLLSNFNAPEVRPAEQKGLGLDALMKSLSVFSGAPSMGNEGETEVGSEEATRSFQYMRQKRIEEDTLTSAVDRWRVETEQMKKMGIDNSLGLQNIGVLMWAWHEALVPLIREEIQKANEADGLTDKGAIDRERQAYGPFLQYLSPEKLSAVTILTCLTAVSTSGVDRALRLSSLLSRVGAAVQDETLADSIKNNRNAGIWRNLSLPDRQQKLASLVKRIHTHSSLAKFVREAEILPHSAKDHSWSTTIKTKVGAVLVAHLIQAAKIHVRRVHPTTGQESKEAQPVFWSTHQYDRGKRVGVVRMNAAMAQKLSKEPVHSALSKHLPMIVEPAPWKGYKQGGYLLQAVSVVRMGLGDQQMKSYVQAAAESGDMDQIFAGLDVLGRTPWKINRGVFNVMIEAWNTGTAIANMPPENPKLDYPPEPEPSDDPRVRQAWRYRIKVIDNERSGFHSTRCFQNFQLEVARAYLNETFYFPHNIDFRGRAYPIPPYLNHMGADNCRGLLLFGKGKELGSAGLTWLKVHLANVFGFDKASFQERQDFATNHLTDIYDSASNPLGGGKWWLKAEDPWQCLAACMELKQALDSPDPTRFVSHLPIHQDGTCNGLQHYAALGGDAIGAKQVNLEPGERPSDIYTAVAEMIKSEIVEDAAQGVEVAQLLEGKVTRKVVKQTVMTNVYGVTFAGAKKQVRRQLEDLLPDFPDRSTVNLDIASYYIAKRIFKALSAMFNGAHDIQYWLGDCAARICEALTPEQIQWIEDDAAGKAESTPFASVPIDRKNIKEEQSRFKSSVIWTTPLKMPVVQPYRTPTSRLVATHLQSIALTEPSISDPVSKRKQLQAFPPNFIHSLDATHMLLSALKCDEVGLSFAAVHDSFWTHAADVDIMNRIIRDAFIRMHTEDIIGRLAAEFSARYKDCMYLASVRANSVLGKKILALRKHTRQTGKKAKQASKFRELLDERRRVRLLASADPAEQAEGEAMMTPSRLFLETADENDLAPLEQLEETGIGKIPSIQQALQSPDLTQEHDEISDVNEDPGDTLQPVGSDGQEEPTTFSADFEHGKIEAVAETDPENELIVQDSMQKTKSKIGKTSKKDRKVLIWLPLTFPPVPKKVCSTVFILLLDQFAVVIKCDTDTEYREISTLQD